eukprot:CCRYP_016255-RA/>CCRYP_016255-RA protein AED:0.21 eAED:0.21 QI:0/-1/0/1/-1/1/1/0/220
MLEAGTIVHTASSVDQTILTVPSRLADSFREQAIDISELTQQDIQRIRDEDPFMYHSILQHLRKMRSSSFTPDRDGVDDELGWESHCPADTVAGYPILLTNIWQTAAVDYNPNPTEQASNDQISTSSEQTVSPLRFSSSSHQASSCYSSPWRRRSTSSHISSSIVTRKRRISAEADDRKEMAELVTSFSAHPRPDLASIFDLDNSGGDFDEVDLSFLEHE